ncbi:MAG: winged helix DNA-binding domain-containing protein, partial [Planctomycetes bacterium]|nr:winged helix DNA-binding domain-containing protein [Planctomycetota bacterium]
AGEELVSAHHGSVSHEKRAQIEEGLKSGRVRAIVATSSLELGIDMGAVDRVLLVESPGSVARGLQRVGRAGHQVGEVSIGRVFPKFRGDLLECAVVAGRMLRGEIEAIELPTNALDVLAQQFTAMCCDTDRTVEELSRIARRAHPYRELTDGAIESVLDMLSGRFPSSDFADLRPLLAWDRTADRLTARRGTATITHMNAGTIPDRGSYAVQLVGGGVRLGELDEEMVYETRPGDNIMLGATTWRVEEIQRNQVIVAPAPGEPGRLPFWRGDGPGRPIELGRAIGEFIAELGERAVGADGSEDDARRFVTESTPLDDHAAQNLVAYIREQHERTGTLPTHARITIERFRDELGDWRVCLLTPFGSRVHAPWAMAIQRILTVRSGFDVQVMYTDDGIVLRFADGEEQPDLDLLIPSPDELEDLVTEQLGDSALFAGLFRENAARALLMTRRRPDQRTPLWVQRVKSQNILATVRQFPDFPVVLETYRQAMRDVFDLPATKALLERLRSRRVKVDEVETTQASPFARSLVFAYVAASIYEQDAPIAERRAQALTLDRQLLAELLGQAELRELLDVHVIEEVEARLQRRAEGWRARDADELHDTFRRLGDLTRDEIAERCEPADEAGDESDANAWIARLCDERRVCELRIPIDAHSGATEPRWIAAEEAGLYRDALGIVPPSGLPDSFLVTRDDALDELIRRYARTHGPFRTEDVAGRFGLPASTAEPVLRSRWADGTLVRGEIHPTGSRPEWCDAEVLRRIKRETIARLRGEASPVDARTLGRFLPEWHGVGGRRRGVDGLLETLTQLEGVPFSYRELTKSVLPLRVSDFTLDMLDLLAASGAIVWIGRGLASASDGRIAIYRRERLAALLEPDDGEAEAVSELTPVHSTILDQLARRGASFQFDLQRAVQAGTPIVTDREFVEALWDLAWSGRVTNDTFAPLSTFGWRPQRSGRVRRSPSFTAGRWSTVESLRFEVSSTERGVALAELLLERYGVVSREAARADETAGGFQRVYRVLQAMEEAGRIRRGYFVEGLSGAQFARPGVIDLLRGAREEREKHEQPPTDDDVVILPASDPAQPYGAVLPWPKPTDDRSRPRRAPQCWAVLVRGALRLFAGSRGRQLITFESDEPVDAELDLAVAALARLPREWSGRMTVETIDQVPVRESKLGARLLAHGFEASYKGYARG